MRFIFSKLAAISLLTVTAFGQQINIDTQIKGSRWPAWGVDSGAANAYAVTTTAPLGPVLRTGSTIAFIATNANTTASTLAVNGGSAIPIKKNVSTALASGDILLSQVVEVIYDGTNFQMLGGAGGSSGGVGIKVNTAAIPGTTGNFNGSTPSAGAGFVNCTWQKDTTTPDTNISVECPDTRLRGLVFTVFNPAGLVSGTTSASYDLFADVPVACTISAYSLAIDTGTITVKWWKKAAGTAIPTSSNSINTSGVGISSGTLVRSTNLTDFITTSVAAHDAIIMDISAVTGSPTILNGVLECGQ